MSAMNQKPRKFVLDKWFEKNFIRFMRGLEPLPPTFSDMPTEIIDQVLEKMEPIDRLRARKVCRSLKTAVDEFGLRFDDISLCLRKDRVELCGSGTEIIYTKAANGCTNVFHNKQTKLIDRENFVERAAKDFKILSKHARYIRISDSTDDKSGIFTTFFEFLKSEKCIHVEEIDLWHFSFDEVLTILSCFDAKWLNKIELYCIVSIDQFERISQLEQWESAEVCTINGANCATASTIIVYFFHFKCFNIYYMDEFPAHTAIQLRDDLLRRSTFKSCEIQFDKSKSNPIEIAKIFKPYYAGGNVFNIEYSNGNDKFDISLQELSYGFLLNMKRPLSV